MEGRRERKEEREREKSCKEIEAYRERKCVKRKKMIGEREKQKNDEKRK